MPVPAPAPARPGTPIRPVEARPAAGSDTGDEAREICAITRATVQAAIEVLAEHGPSTSWHAGWTSAALPCCSTGPPLPGG